MGNTNEGAKDGGTGASAELPEKQVGDIAQEVFEVFTPVFVKAAGIAIVHIASEKDRVEKHERKAGAPEWRLLKPPIPSEPLKVGWMTKMGESRKHKSWRRR